MPRGAPSLGRISKERIYAELTQVADRPYASHGLETLRGRPVSVGCALPELAPWPTMPDGPASRTRKRISGSTPSGLSTRRRSSGRPLGGAAARRRQAADPLGDAVRGSPFLRSRAGGADIARALLRRLNADQRHPGSRAARWSSSTAGRRPTSWTGPTARCGGWCWRPAPTWTTCSTWPRPTSLRPAQRQQLARSRIDALRERIERLEAERAIAEYQSPLDGTELMALFGRPPGRWIAEIKDHLRELVIDGELSPDDKEQAAEIARSIVETS